MFQLKFQIRHCICSDPSKINFIISSLPGDSYNNSSQDNVVQVFNQVLEVKTVSSRVWFFSLILCKVCCDICSSQFNFLQHQPNMNTDYRENKKMTNAICLQIFLHPGTFLLYTFIASLWSINIFRNNIQIIPQRSMTQPSTIDLPEQSRGEHLFYIRNALNQLSRDTIWYFERAKLTQMHILMEYYQVIMRGNKWRKMST